MAPPSFRRAADPAALGQALDALEVDVRPEAATIDADGRDAAVGRHRERQDVEALGAVTVVEDELRVGRGHGTHRLEGLRVVPAQAVDRRRAVGPEPAVEAQHPRVGSGREHAAGRPHRVHEPVAGDPHRRELGRLQRFATQRLEGIPPELRDAHGGGNARRPDRIPQSLSLQSNVEGGRHACRMDGRQPRWIQGDVREGPGGARADAPAGGIFHCAGPSPNGGWRVIEVWESEEDAMRFRNERLMPAFEAVGAPTPSAPEFWPLHNVMTGAPQLAGKR